MTTTETRAAQPDGESTTAPTTKRTAKKRKGRPVRRLFIVTHRWLSLILGLVLLAITVSGSILLYKPEIQRALNSDAYETSGKPAVVSLAEARQIVLDAHPKYHADSVWDSHGVLRVTDYETSYTVDPGTGEILGFVEHPPAWLEFVDNVHLCLLSCEEYPGYVGFLAKEVPGTGWLGFDGAMVTWGGLTLGIFGVLLVYLSMTGLWLWFPRPGKWKKSMSVRWKRGRFARDTDMHNVAGMIAIPLLLIWGITGAGYEFEFVEKSFYAATPGKNHPEVEPASNELPKGDKTPDIPIEQAVTAAKALHPDANLVNVDVPHDDEPTSAYTFYFSQGFDPWAGGDYPGEIGVYVDRHTGVAKDYYNFKGQPAGQTIWEDWNYPTHSGYVANSWWRIIWLILGMAPLLLAITGVSTWLVRRASRKARKAATKAGTEAPALPDELAKQLADDPEQDPGLARTD